MSPTCPKCHRFKRKKVFNRHRKTCVPTREDMIRYSISKSSNLDEKKKKRQAKKDKKKKRKK